MNFRSAAILAILLTQPLQFVTAQEPRPNILFAMADDWSWPHASAYGMAEISTPNFDRVAREGLLIHNAFTAAPQCSPNRAALLTGRHIWQIDEAGTHGSIFPNTWPVYPDLLEAAGYFIGYTGKPWGPGSFERGGWERNPAGPEFNQRELTPPADGINDNDYAGNFVEFLSARSRDVPFCFWFGAKEPHRRYEAGSGIRAGKNPDNVAVPAFLPDTPETRSDLLDYFAEIEWFDFHLGRMLVALEAAGELENTIVVVTGDNGMPFPRAKANVYDYGVHVPMAIRWGGIANPGRETNDLVSFIDLAPTFLEATGVTLPDTFTGKSFAGLLTGDASWTPRPHVLFGRERHTHARYDNLGYPARAIRTSDRLLIWNVKPDRWPAGDPDQYHDIDPSPSKTLVLSTTESFKGAAVGKRPEWEFFNTTEDPANMNNLIANDSTRIESLQEKLKESLRNQGDPRMHGRGDIFEYYPRVSSMRPELGGFAERGEYNEKYRPRDE